MTIARSITGPITKSITRGITSLDEAAADLVIGFGDNLGVPSGLLTFARSSSRTILGSDVVLRTLGNNVFATDHDGSGNPLGLPIEGAATNLIDAGRNMPGASWSDDLTSVTNDQEVSPDGTTNATELVFGAAETTNIGQDVASATSAGATYTLSIWAKTTSGTESFRLGVFGTVTGYDLEEFEATTEWQRFTVTKTYDASDTSRFFIIRNKAAGGAGTVYVDFPMMEAGSVATSTILAGTRAEESATIPFTVGTALSGIVRGRTAAGTSGTQVLFQIDDGTADESIQIHRNSSGDIHFVVTAGGVGVADIDLGAVADNTDIEVRFSAAAGDYRASLDGTLGTPDTSGAFPASMTTGRIGHDVTPANHWFGHFKSASLFLSTKTDDFLQG